MSLVRAFSLSSMCRAAVVPFALALGGCGDGERSDDDRDSVNGDTVYIGGTVSGLLGPLTLKNNEVASLLVSTNGPFRFRKRLAKGSVYHVTVGAQPLGQICAVTAGDGIARTSVTTVQVNCITRAGTGELAFEGVTTNPVAQTADVMPFTLTLNLRSAQRLQLIWGEVAGSTHYQVLEDPTGEAGLSPLSANAAATNTTLEIVVPLYLRTNARYAVRACQRSACIESNTVTVAQGLAAAAGRMVRPIPVALSADGTTLAVGSAGADLCSVDVGGDEMESSACDTGAVHVFSNVGNRWVEQSVLQAPNPEPGDLFGYSAILSSDGDVLVVETRSVRCGNSQNESRLKAVYVFARLGADWMPQARPELHSLADSSGGQQCDGM